MRPLPLLAAIGLALLPACGGCHGDDAGGPDAPVTDAPADAPTDAPIDAAVAPVFRNPVTLPDLTLAQQAAALLGQGATDNCDNCHALTRTRLHDWDARTDAGEAACLANLSPATPAEAMAIVTCLLDPQDGHWHPGRIGIDATAAGLPWFEYVFHLAYGDAWQAPFDEWKARVWMPRGGLAPFTQPQFDIVAEWFARGLPDLDQVIPVDPPPPPCTTMVTAAVATHVTTMQTAGWRTLNRDDGILMFGCQGATTPLGCLATYPTAADRTWAQGWSTAAPATTLRILRENTYQSSYWTRSSADGRFVAHGGGATAGATVIDLAQDREIPADAFYDPGFFPDNTGFVIQGGGWCRQSLLTSSPAHITFTEPECSDVSVVGLYQHLGAVRGGDYWTVHGQFTSDNGGVWSVTGDDPSAVFGGIDHLTPMIYTGTAYQAKPTIDISTGSEGDLVISPSSKLLIGRTAASIGSTYVMRRVDATPSGGTYTVQVPVIARYCVSGAKPAFSYDERWLAYHHYVAAGDWQALGYPSASDPGFVALRTQGASNLFVLDLLTGEERRITTMGPGQYALYPHFRSDGWIYAMVRDRVRNREYVIASNAALIFEQP